MLVDSVIKHLNKTYNKMKKQLLSVLIFLLGFGIQNTFAQQPYEVDFSVTSQWSGGATVNVTLTNYSSQLNGWNLDFDLPSTISNFWNTSITQTGSQVNAANLNWNGTVTSGSSVSFGFNVSTTGTLSFPDSVAINGTSVAATNNVPSVAFTSPDNQVYPISTSPNLHITVETENATSVSFTRNGQPITFALVHPGAYVLHDNTTVAGSYQIIATVVGAAGQISTDVINYAVGLPSISFDHPSNQTAFRSTSNPILSIVAEIEGDLSDVSTVTFTRNGVSVPFGLVVPGTYVLHDNTTVIGNFEVIATVETVSGYTVEETFNYRVEDFPSISFVTPADSSIQTAYPYSLVAKVESAAQDVASVEFFINGESVYTFDPQSSNDPFYVYRDNSGYTGDVLATAVITTNAGQTETATLFYRVEERPSISFVTPDEGAVQTALPYSLVAKVESDALDVASVEFFINGVSVYTYGPQAANDPFYVYRDNSAFEGDIVATATVTTLGGQTATATLNYKTVAPANTPQITITDPVAGQIIYYPSVRNSFNATVTDANGTIEEVLFIVEGDTLADYYGPNAPYYDASFDPAAYGEGTYDLTVIATDNDGAVSQRTVSFEVVSYLSSSRVGYDLRSASSIAYPNPASSDVSVDGATSLQLVDLQGSIIATSNGSTLDLSNVKNGNYILKAVVETGVTSSPIIVVK